MRLSSIKMSGFKSFVEPTLVKFPYALTGVVGPNGCGKSNIIDAIRWVLGESARNIRGQSLGDVIFDGSAARERLDQASIEVTIDNEAGRIGGEYANFSEIVIRREVSRSEDTQSRYLINGALVRRKDVADLFQGTGLGRGNYAIIAQGMVQRLIEAKPDDMRKLIEEAAEISGYQVSRRETENRIKRTEENLNRSNDNLSELKKQRAHLQRAKKQAEQARAFRQELNQREGELVSLQLREREKDLNRQDARCQAIEYTRNMKERELDQRKAALAEKRKEHDACQQASAEEQGRYFQTNSEAQTLKDKIKHKQERYLEAEKDIQGREKEIEKVQGTIQTLERELNELKSQRDVETTHQKWRTELNQAQDRLQTLETAEAANAQVLKQLEQTREQIEQRTHQVRNEQTEANGRLTGLETVQQEGLASDPEAHQRALAQMQLQGTRLADFIQVEEGWEFAVETVLSNRLGAICVEGLPDQLTQARVDGHTPLTLIDKKARAPGDSDPLSLISKVQAPISLESQLGQVLAAETLAQAYAVRPRLLSHQSIIVRDGVWLGRDWIQLPSAESRAEGALKRQRKIESIQVQLKQKGDELSDLAQTLQENAAAIRKRQEQENQRKQEHNDIFQEHARIKARLEEKDRPVTHVEDSLTRERQRLSDLQSSVQGLQRRLSENNPDRHQEEEQCKKQQEAEALHKKLEQSRGEVQKAFEEAQRMDELRSKVEREFSDLRDKVHEADTKRAEIEFHVTDLRGKLHALQLDLEAVLASLPEDASEEQWKMKVEEIENRLGKLPPINEASITEFAEVDKEVEEKERQHEDIETALKELTDAIARIDRQTRDLFKRTFDEVNENLQAMFPRIIGQGGRADLTMTEQNLLTTGIEVRACPPGKRYRSMHALSGGEQAMVAVALVLSLFKRNPAPFCILDEVDAPLSDDNLQRFCEIIEEMSEDVQFITITHNKITMEHVDQLIGVTMNEPGVSRLVSVDVAQAMEMAGQDDVVDG